MADDDLISLPGLLDKHRKILDERLGITTYDGLLGTDAQVIFEAVSRVRPRTSLAVIRRWQDVARRKRKEAVVETPDWDPAAIFVLSFEQRQVGDHPERRLVAEQTELEVEQEISSWPGWDGMQLCEWLQQRVGGAEATPGEAASPGREPAQDQQVSPPGPRRAGAAELSIKHVVMADATVRVEAVSEGRPTAEALACTAPAWLEVTVLGAAPDREVRVALRFRGTDEVAGVSALDPVAVPDEGPARIELSEAAAGVHRARLVAWAPDGSAAPTAVDLGTLTIRSLIQTKPTQGQSLC